MLVVSFIKDFVDSEANFRNMLFTEKIGEQYEYNETLCNEHGEAYCGTFVNDNKQSLWINDRGTTYTIGENEYFHTRVLKDINGEPYTFDSGNLVITDWEVVYRAKAIAPIYQRAIDDNTYIIEFAVVDNDTLELTVELFDEENYEPVTIIRKE